MLAKRDLKMGKSKSSDDAWKDYLKTWDGWNSQSFQGYSPGPNKVGLTAPPYELPVAMANMLALIGLWPMAIKLKPLWKTEVSKSAWTKPYFILFLLVCKKFLDNLIFLRNNFISDTLFICLKFKFIFNVFTFSRKPVSIVWFSKK